MRTRALKRRARSVRESCPERRVKIARVISSVLPSGAVVYYFVSSNLPNYAVFFFSLLLARSFSLPANEVTSIAAHSVPLSLRRRRPSTLSETAVSPPPPLSPVFLFSANERAIDDAKLRFSKRAGKSRAEKFQRDTAPASLLFPPSMVIPRCSYLFAVAGIDCRSR